MPCRTVYRFAIIERGIVMINASHCPRVHWNKRPPDNSRDAKLLRVEPKISVTIISNVLYQHFSGEKSGVPGTLSSPILVNSS